MTKTQNQANLIESDPESVTRDRIIAPIAQLVEHRIRNAAVVCSNQTWGSLWSKTKYANLWRYVPSGSYFVIAKIGGKMLNKSLKTKSQEIAKAKMDRLLDSHRALRRRHAVDGQTLSDHYAAYLSQIRASGIKPRSIDYREETWAMIQRTWSGVESLSAGHVRKVDCENWARTVRTSKSATRFNGCLETLRGVFKVAIQAGACLDDPTAQINRASVILRRPKLPTTQQFNAMLAKMDKDCRTRAAALMIRLLAYTGMRITEALNLAPSDIDLAKGWLTVRVTKNGIPRDVPIIKEALPVLKKIVDGAPLIHPRRALGHGSKDFPQRLTPHKLRHYFTTICLESGVDIRTVAGWRGDQDNGAMLLRVYAHLRDGHSKKQAGKVKFG